MNHLLRRGIGLLAAPALAATAVAAVPAPAGAAEPDPVPVQHGSAWLAAQLTDGLVHNDQYGFDDLGLSVDVALAADAVDATATVTAVADALAPRVQEYTSYYVAEGKTHVSAGSIAKAVVLALLADGDPREYGDQDLVAQLEDRVSTEPADRGRISDIFFPEEAFEADFSNTIGQSFAARALDAADGGDVAEVTDFLLLQQCEEGFFRLDLGADTAATCDADPGAVASTDVTALAVLNLQGLTGDPDVAAAVDAAVGWLGTTQRADGSFGSDGQIAVSNANSTGLAGWALGETGRTAAAERAAIWVRSVQAADPAQCASALAGATGAIAYGPTELETARRTGITATTRDQFRRATAQALPTLRYAPRAATAPRVTGPQGFVRGGAKLTLNVSGIAPGGAACLSGPGTRAALSGTNGVQKVAVTTPAATGNRAYTLVTADGAATATLRVLGKTRLKAAPVKKRVGKGARQRVRVTGLAAGERIVVRVAGKRVGAGKATRKGAFAATFKVTGKPGKRAVRVVGQFSNRTGKTAFRVVR